MLYRLMLGLIKGLIVGAAVGYGLAAAGMTWGWMAYVAAAITGMLVALVAGKPIWGQDARIEVGMKAAAGAVLGPGLMWLVRSFLTMPIPFDVNTLPGLESMTTTGLTVGTFGVTALALVAAVLGGFYDADNQPESKEDKEVVKADAKKKRIAAGSPDVLADVAEMEAVEAEAAERKHRS